MSCVNLKLCTRPHPQVAHLQPLGTQLIMREATGVTTTGAPCVCDMYPGSRVEPFVSIVTVSLNAVQSIEDTLVQFRCNAGASDSSTCAWTVALLTAREMSSIDGRLKAAISIISASQTMAYSMP